MSSGWIQARARKKMTRPLIVGPTQPEAPYPYVVKTEITSGFGRGSSELGIPTANIPPGKLNELDVGVYYGWSHVKKHSTKTSPKTEHVNKREIHFNFGSDLCLEDCKVYPMVMSIGYNPFYNNKEKSCEVHILHNFAHLFYGAEISIVVAGFIRPEQSYDGVDSLIKDIKFDMEVAKNSLQRSEYLKLKELLN